MKGERLPVPADRISSAGLLRRGLLSARPAEVVFHTADVKPRSRRSRRRQHGAAGWGRAAPGGGTEQAAARCSEDGHDGYFKNKNFVVIRRTKSVTPIDKIERQPAERELRR